MRAFVCFFLAALPAFPATLTIFYDRAQWEAAIGPYAIVTETFNSITTDTPFNESPLVVGDLTLSAAPGGTGSQYFVDAPAADTPASFPSSYVAMYHTGTSSQFIDATVRPTLPPSTHIMYAIGADMTYSGNPGTDVRVFYTSGTEAGYAFLHSPGFVGFVVTDVYHPADGLSELGIGSIVGPHPVGLDNVSWAVREIPPLPENTIPEPSTWTSMVAAVVMGWCVGRRRVSGRIPR
jgi:hypothetical protein